MRNPFKLDKNNKQSKFEQNKLSDFTLTDHFILWVQFSELGAIFCSKSLKFVFVWSLCGIREFYFLK